MAHALSHPTGCRVRAKKLSTASTFGRKLSMRMCGIRPTASVDASILTSIHLMAAFLLLATSPLVSVRETSQQVVSHKGEKKKPRSFRR
jgi:hypothetical protein